MYISTDNLRSDVQRTEKYAYAWRLGYLSNCIKVRMPVVFRGHEQKVGA